ncbi:MAG: hypothetical protein K9J37_19100 [Saprospiraceae bacterium]|nr:hypothetical protein [Saprospiraceae bacterium]MCF8252032.1 hypothetical protein [Saprospiraceae bacterium]MCF8281721.1 hypothetical protein [Bacteroidales bacterium]MCF8310391.1 hypothetical protein [Saprospiraceae bacterium]MCF8439769.1 hypothetical protein [Saprospiraceae bacterium]
MKIPDTYKLNFHPLDLEVVEVLDFQGVPVLTVEQNHAGFKYLSYLLQYAEGGLEQRLVLPITEARLEGVKSGQISVRDAFNTSELEQVFCLLYDEATGEALESWMLPSEVFGGVNPVKEDYNLAVIA